MRVSRLVGFLGVPSVANAGTLGDLQRSTLTLGSATWKAVYNGMIEVKQVATVYCPTVANQTIKLSGNVRLPPSQMIIPPSVELEYPKRPKQN